MKKYIKNHKYTCKYCGYKSTVASKEPLDRGTHLSVCGNCKHIISIFLWWD